MIRVGNLQRSDRKPGAPVAGGCDQQPRDRNLARVLPGGPVCGNTPARREGSAPWQGLRRGDLETGGSRAAATGCICERDRYRMDETAGISSAGAVRPIARVEPGPTVECGRVRPKKKDSDALIGCA